ncbi:MAG: hypothetical protein M8353_10605 [ANME-2 cluster archaeon]|nr:hypothetical protein [ANME-2 cluster archaeon]
MEEGVFTPFTLCSTAFLMDEHNLVTDSALEGAKHPSVDAQGFSISIGSMGLDISIQAQAYLSQQFFKFFNCKPGSFN